MATVVLNAQLPSVRLGLAAMLAEAGHEVVREIGAAVEDGAVWVVDDPGGAALLATGSLPDDQPLVVLTDDPSVATRLAARGGRGWSCLPRDVAPEDLDLAVRAAEAGLVLLDLPIASRVVGPATRTGHGDGMDNLTQRELEVLQLVAQGLPNKGIARALGISENTAKFHVASLTGKLGAASRTEAVTLAARRGLLVL